MINRFLRKHPVILTTFIILNAAGSLYAGFYENDKDYLLLSLEKPGSKNRKEIFESEHRPQLNRVYWLNDRNIKTQPKGYILSPDAVPDKLPFHKSIDGWNISVKMSIRGKDRDIAHGANNLYVTDQISAGNSLLIRTAKWIVIQHSCSWGHEHKHNKKRLTPQYFDKIPLEIVPAVLWDGNFHVKTRSGDIIKLRIYHYGKPAAGAAVTVRSAMGWIKKIKADQNGEVNFQLIRDYYPESWDKFERNRKSRLLFYAEYDLNAKNHSGTRYTSTLSWRYIPAYEDYASYKSGLLIAILFLIASAGGIFFYREKRNPNLLKRFQ